MTPLSTHTTDRIREAASIATVVGRYVPLKKSGAQLVGLCCFHRERTPSLSVHPGKGLFLCRSCGAGGDVFTFLQRIEGVSFVDARRQLAQEFGIPLEDRPQTREERAAARRQAVYIREVSEEAAVWWSWVRQRYQGRFETLMAIAIGCSDRGWEEWYQQYARRAWRWGKILRLFDARGPQWMFQAYARIRDRAAVRAVIAQAEAEKKLWQTVLSSITPSSFEGFLIICAKRL